MTQESNFKFISVEDDDDETVEVDRKASLKIEKTGACRKTEPENEQNLDIPVETHKERAVPEIITIAAQYPVLTVEKSAFVMIFAYDSDNFNSPVLAGVRFSDYDTSLIRFIGNTVFALGTGTTRVKATWNGYTCDFIVNVK